MYMKTLFTREKRWYRVILFGLLFMTLPFLVSYVLNNLIQ